MNDWQIKEETEKKTKMNGHLYNTWTALIESISANSKIDPLTKSVINKIIPKQNMCSFKLCVNSEMNRMQNNLHFFYYFIVYFQIIVKLELKTPIFIQIIQISNFRIEWFTKLCLPIICCNRTNHSKPI